MRGGFKVWLVNVVCGLLAYAGSRVIWQRKELDFGSLAYELLTFVVLYLVLQLLVRGRRLARRGKRA